MDLHEESESEDADLARGGDLEAAARLFEQYRGRLVRMIELRLGPPLNARVDVADVLQEAFLEMHKRIAEFRILKI